MVEKIIEERSIYWREILVVLLIGFAINLLADEVSSSLPSHIWIFPTRVYLILFSFFLIILFAFGFILKPIYLHDIIDFFLVYNHNTDHFWPLKGTGFYFADYFRQELFNIMPEKKEILIEGDIKDIENFFVDLIQYLILHFLQINYFLGWDITTIGEIRYMKAFQIKSEDSKTLKYDDLPEHIKNNTFMNNMKNAKEWSIKIPQNVKVNWIEDPFTILFNNKYGSISIRILIGPKGKATIDQLYSLTPSNYDKETLQYFKDESYAFSSFYIIFNAYFKKWWRLFRFLWGSWGLKFVQWSQDIQQKLIENFS